MPHPIDLERRATELYTCPDCGAILDYPNDPDCNCPAPDLRGRGAGDLDEADLYDRQQAALRAAKRERVSTWATVGFAGLCGCLIALCLGSSAVDVDRLINEAKAAAWSALGGGQ